MVKPRQTGVLKADSSAEKNAAQAEYHRQTSILGSGQVECKACEQDKPSQAGKLYPDKSIQDKLAEQNSGIKIRWTQAANSSTEIANRQSKAITKSANHRPSPQPSS